MNSTIDVSHYSAAVQAAHAKAETAHETFLVLAAMQAELGIYGATKARREAAIAALAPILAKGEPVPVTSLPDTFRVPSRSNPKVLYTLNRLVDGVRFSCTCDGFRFRQSCDHSKEATRREAIGTEVEIPAAPKSGPRRTSVNLVAAKGAK